MAGVAGTTLEVKNQPLALWTQNQTYSWSLVKTIFPNPVPWVIPLGQSQTASFTITAERTGPVSTSVKTPVTSSICVKNTGTSPTSGLYIRDQIEKTVDSSVVEGPIVMPVTSEIPPSETRCFSDEFTALIDPTVSYQNHASISIDNYLDHEGTSFTIESVTQIVPVVTPVDVDATATLTDLLQCPIGFECVPIGFNRVVSGSIAIPWDVRLTNSSATCNQLLIAENTAQLIPSTHPIPQTATAALQIFTGPCDPIFNPGDYCTYSQGGWGAPPIAGNAGQILAKNFDGVYPTGVFVGSQAVGEFPMRFTSSSAIDAYLPAAGVSGALNANLLNPITTSSGVFGGQVLALRLNVDFNEAHLISGTQGSISGLILTHTGTSLDGQTITQVLAQMNTALGGGALPSGFTYALLNTLAANLDLAFDRCLPSDWAQTHLTRPFLNRNDDHAHLY